MESIGNPAVILIITAAENCPRRQKLAVHPASPALHFNPRAGDLRGACNCLTFAAT
jgi:hypothetical protein